MGIVSEELVLGLTVVLLAALRHLPAAGSLPEGRYICPMCMWKWIELR